MKLLIIALHAVTTLFLLLPVAGGDQALHDELDDAPVSGQVTKDDCQKWCKAKNVEKPKKCAANCMKL